MVLMRERLPCVNQSALSRPHTPYPTPPLSCRHRHPPRPAQHTCTHTHLHVAGRQLLQQPLLCCVARLHGRCKRPRGSSWDCRPRPSPLLPYSLWRLGWLLLLLVLLVVLLVWGLAASLLLLVVVWGLAAALLLLLLAEAGPRRLLLLLGALCRRLGSARSGWLVGLKAAARLLRYARWLPPLLLLLLLGGGASTATPALAPAPPPPARAAAHGGSRLCGRQRCGQHGSCLCGPPGGQRSILCIKVTEGWGPLCNRLVRGPLCCAAKALLHLPALGQRLHAPPQHLRRMKWGIIEKKCYHCPHIFTKALLHLPACCQRRHAAPPHLQCMRGCGIWRVFYHYPLGAELASGCAGLNRWWDTSSCCLHKKHRGPGKAEQMDTSLILEHLGSSRTNPKRPSSNKNTSKRFQ